MKSIFDSTVRADIVRRIDSLTTNDQPKWGKMTVSQMVRHCVLCEEYYLGNMKIDRSFIGRIFGKNAIRKILKDEQSTFQKNAPTAKSFLVREMVSDLEGEKAKWKSLIEKYGSFQSGEFTHWFFGEMTKEQLGQFIYKHCDHHLKQFGAY